MNKKLNITGEEYRHKIRQQAKARTIKFREAQEERGYKNLTVYLSKAFRDELERLSTDQGLNRQDAMDHIFNIYQQAVSGNIKDHVTSSMTSNVTIGHGKNAEMPVNPAIKAISKQVVQDAEQDAARLQADLDKPKKTVTEKALDLFTNEQTAPDLEKLFEGLDPDNITIEQRDMLVLRLHEQYPGKKHAQDRIKILNDKKIYYNGKPWTTKDFSDQANHARRRTKKRAKIT